MTNTTNQSRLNRDQNPMQNTQMQNRFYLKFFIGLLICLLGYLFIGLFVLAELAQASSLSLRVSPPIIRIQTKAPADIDTELKIENPTQQTIDLEIVLKPFQSKNEKGEISYLSETDGFSQKPDPSLLEKVEIRDEGTPITHLTLSPFQEKNLTLHLHLPAEEKTSDYYFSILYRSNPEYSIQNTLEENKTTLQTQVGIAQHILLSIKDHSLPAKGIIEEFSAPVFSRNGPIPFVVQVKNNSDFFIVPDGVINIKNIFNQTVGNIDLSSTAILAKSNKLLTSPNFAWKNGFLFGSYTATLTLSLSKPATSENTYIRSIHFYVLPIRQLAEIGGIILLFLFVKKRIKKYQ